MTAGKIKIQTKKVAVWEGVKNNKRKKVKKERRKQQQALRQEAGINYSLVSF